MSIFDPKTFNFFLMSLPVAFAPAQIYFILEIRVSFDLDIVGGGVFCFSLILNLNFQKKPILTDLLCVNMFNFLMNAHKLMHIRF